LAAESLPGWRGVGREHVVESGRHQSLLYARKSVESALADGSRVLASVPGMHIYIY